MAVIDLVKWNAPADVYAWKYPSDELSTWTQLIVSESQEAVLFRGGEILGHFKAGRHTLTTENIPLLTSIVKIPFGGKSPFKAEVWFVNRTIPLDVRWGTADPIQLLDPKSRVMIPVRAFGQFGVQIEDTKKFLIKLVGTLPSFDKNQLISYFRGVMVTNAKDIIAKRIIKDQISILEVAANLSEISKSLQEDMAAEFEEFGLKLVRFFVNSINVPDDDPAVIKLRDAYARKAEMDIVGYTYQQERSFNTLEKAAGNQGSSAAPIMGAGIGLGMGLGLGGAVGKSMASASDVMNVGGGGAAKTCPACRTANPADNKYCSKCGGLFDAPESAAPAAIKCDKCSASSPPNSKFCAGCGATFYICPRCGSNNPGGAIACQRCSTLMPITCKTCGGASPSVSNFCIHCGKPLTTKCVKCSAPLPPQSKFCPSCGTPTLPNTPTTP
ncbi:MAG: SPFH domain-containing protein [Planctomycetes bacterium]|nr:SPFH domain-containing protein [Planctomycetota bacterium]